MSSKISRKSGKKCRKGGVYLGLHGKKGNHPGGQKNEAMRRGEKQKWD